MLSILKLLTWTASGLQPVSHELVLGTIGALLAFFSADRYHRMTGINPWKIPAPLWAVFAFLSPLGLVMEVIARIVSAKKISREHTDFSLNKRSGMTGWMNGSSQQMPGKHHLATNTYEREGQDQTTGYPEKTHLPLFGWYPDIYEKYKYRYWDGKSWTKFVSDGKARSIDGDFPQ